MKALVTGGNSFVGSTLIEELDTLGFEVFAMLDQNASASNLEGLKFKRVEGSLYDFSSLCHAVEDMKYVFHLEETCRASRRSEFFEYNTKGTERLAQAVLEMNVDHRERRTGLHTGRSRGIARFVYFSSLAAAGPAHSLCPKIETEIEEPISSYGLSKLEGERCLRRYTEEFPISIIRPAMAYGPRDKVGAFVIRALSRGFMPDLQGSSRDGHKYYSTVHVSDLCRGLVQAAVLPQDRVPSGELFYLSGDGVHTLQDLMAVIAERMNCDPLRIRIPKTVLQLAATALTAIGRVGRRSFPLNLDRLNEILSDYWICSNQKAKKMLGFAPEFDLSSGVAHAVEWYKRQRWI